MSYPTNTVPRPFPALMWVLGSFVAAAGFWRACPDTIDDAYITFRYARNFVAGHGLAYNPGQIVEGYSNPLFLALMIPFEMIGLPLPIAAMMIGLASFAVCIIAAWKIAGHLDAAPWQRHAAGALTLGYFPLLYYSITGLETGLYAALIATALWRYFARAKRVDGFGALLWLLVALSRPEGILYPAVLGAYELIRLLRGGNNRSSVLWLLSVGAGFCLFLVWRKLYFDMWVPNTFVAKPMGTADLDTGVSPLVASLNYFFGFLAQSGWVLPGLALLTIRRRESIALWLVIASGILFGFYTGGDWMPAARYLIPVYVPLIVLGVCGLGTGIEHMLQRGVRPVLVQSAAVVLLLAGFAAPTLVLRDFIISREYAPYHTMNTQTCKAAAIAMREKYGSGSSIVARRIGALGYYSDMYVVDLFGLVDRRIAEIISDYPDYHPSNGIGDDIPALGEYIRSKEPDLVLVIGSRMRMDPTRELYGYTYEWRESHRLGIDQVWNVYERTE